jgi:hypothetical protein
VSAAHKRDVDADKKLDAWNEYLREVHERESTDRSPTPES